MRALIFVSDSLGELCIDALSTPRSTRIRRMGMSLEGQRGVQFCEVTLGCFIISNSKVWPHEMHEERTTVAISAIFTI